MISQDNPVPALQRIADPQRIAACQSVTHGRVYDLGLEINHRMPQGSTPELMPFSLFFTATPNQPHFDLPFRLTVDGIVGCLHTSTHIDGLAHVEHNDRLFGGRLSSEIRTDSGFRELGAETIAPIVGRGLLLDIGSLLSADCVLPDGYEISVADVRAALDHIHATVQDGDIVLVRTGKIREFWSDPAAFDRAQPGIGSEAATWLYEQGMAVLATDTSGTEPYPTGNSRSTHVAMLVERGVHLIESVYLEDCISDGVSTGLFICLPLRFTGATGSWVRPVLVV
jgi:kynurenine formamidase